MRLLIEARHPIKTVLVNYFCIQSSFSFNVFVCYLTEWSNCRPPLQPTHPEPDVSDEWSLVACEQVVLFDEWFKFQHIILSI